MDTTEIPTPQPGCDGDPLASITERWADLLGCTSAMCRVMRAFNRSIDIGYAPMGLGEQVLDELTRLGNLVDAARISITPAVIDSGQWKREGAKSPEDWLAGKAGSSTGRARAQLETGKNLRKAPGTQESFLNGEISAEQAGTIADAVEANPAAEQDLLDQAENDSLKNLKDEAARRKAEVEDIEERERRLHRKRYVRQWTDKEGAWNLRARGPIPTGSAFMAVLEGLIDQQFKKARKTGVRGTRDNYGYDALMDLANQHGWGTGNGTTGGSGNSGGPDSGGTSPGSSGRGPRSGGSDPGTGPGRGATRSDGSGPRGRSAGNKPGVPAPPAPESPASSKLKPDRVPSGGPGSSNRSGAGRRGSSSARNTDPFEPVDSGCGTAKNQGGGGNARGIRSAADDHGDRDGRQASGGGAIGRHERTVDAPASAANSPGLGQHPGVATGCSPEGRLFDLDPASDNLNPPEPERQAHARPPGRKQPNPAKQRTFCIDWTALARGRIHPGERCELRGVGMVSVRTIRQALVSGTARMVVTDANDRVITVALIGTGAINGRLFPMGSGTNASLEAPDAADLTAAEASADASANTPSTVIVGVRLTDLAAPTKQTGRTSSGTIDIPGVGPVSQTRLTDLLGSELAGRLAERGKAIRTITHTGRAPSAAQRVALAWADTTCKVAGCHNQRVEIDHRNPWASDRVTELNNLDPLCAHHHSLKTHEGWAFTDTDSNSDHPQFVSPTDQRHPRFSVTGMRGSADNKAG